ncbi:MAG: SDR family NAD(P)-dependent oxidoreductase [Clostridiales bacterium]|nr:SDR family NAD(P)-dependent oxidoreductase [Clostridiales bacterium]
MEVRIKNTRLAGQTAVITGASSGIGRELTKLLISRYGCSVIGLARNEEKLKGLSEELGNLSGRFSWRVFDVSERANWRKFAAELAGSGTQVNMLFNNAGIMPPVARFETAEKDPDNCAFRVMNTDFYASLYAVWELLPLLRRSGEACIVNISSAAAFVSLPGTAMYCAAKAALRAFSECLAQELGGGVFVATVCPGFVRTDLFRNQSEECMTRLVLSFCMQPAKAALKIIRGVIKRRHMIVPGADAKIMRFLHGLFGTAALDLFAFLLRASHIKLYSEVFTELPCGADDQSDQQTAAAN